MAWHVARMLTQLTWVVLLARALGAEGYGVFSGVAGLALSISGFAGLGLGLRMYQDVAREPAQYALRWRQAWRALWWSAGGLAMIFMTVGLWVFAALGWELLFAVALSEVFFAPFATHVAFAFAAHGRMSLAAAVPVMLGAARVVAVLAFEAINADGRIAIYASFHAVATGLAVIGLTAFQRRKQPADDVRAPLDWRDVRTGLGFSGVWASGMALGSADKAVALKAGGAEVAGHYTVAYRFASLVALPVDALVMAAMPRLFRAGAGKLEHPGILSVLASVTFAYGLLAGGVVWFAADALPWLLGEGFIAAAEIARMLAIYVPIYCMRSLGCNVLVAFEQKRWRFISELAALGMMILIGFARIPVAGSAGAVEALIFGELSLIALVWWRVISRQSLLGNIKA
jgi:O-antigen/teichoic acid export membrane protein